MIGKDSMFRVVVAGAAALLSAGAGEAAFAQDNAGSDALALEEVVVTARRAEEKLLDVPVAVTAFTADQIESRGIRNLDDIAALTPGLQFSNVLGEFLPAPVLRGVAPVSIFAENNVGIYIDGVYVAGREGLNFSQLDLEAINVVKGPQAALYSRAAFSGAINYVTARPTREPLRKAELQLGNDGKRLGQVVASGPLFGDSLMGRIAVGYDTWDGSYDNQIVGGPDIGGYEYKTASGSLLWAPGGDFQAYLWGYYSDDAVDPSATSEVLANCENRNIVDPMQSTKFLNFCGELPSINRNSLSAIRNATGEKRDVQRVHLELKWDLAGGTLTSLSSYSKVTQTFLVDGTRGTGSVTYAYAAMAASPSPTAIRPIRTFQATLLQTGFPDTTEEVAQELRFASAQDRAFRWTGGLYFYDNRGQGGSDGVVAQPGLPADFAAFCPCTFPTGGTTLGFPTPGASAGADASFLPWFNDPNGAGFPLAIRNDTQGWSVFGAVDYDFTDALTLRAEARWTEEKREPSAFLASGALSRTAEESWSLPSWRVNLRYKPAPNWTLYASVADAPKSGDFATGTVRFVDNPTVQVPVFRPYDSEEILAYELGAKAELFGGRVRTEFDVFWYDWKDQVIPNIVEEVDGRRITIPTSFETNAGDATVKGAEFSIEGKVTERLRLNAGVALIDSKYDEAALTTFQLFPSFAPTGAVNGKYVLRQSRTQYNLGLGYEAPVRDSLAFYVRSDYAYRGKQYADSVNQAIIPEQGFLNASIGLRGDGWTVELWGRNLTHEDAPTGAFRDVQFTNTAANLPFAGGGSFFPFRWSVSHPRLTTYGITGRVRF
jgi:iron complex outermembrane receptor protein